VEFHVTRELRGRPDGPPACAIEVRDALIALPARRWSVVLSNPALAEFEAVAAALEAGVVAGNPQVTAAEG
jgi:hypothetical protein